MSNKMLIDASHPEETRVVVVRGNRIEEFDFESEHKKQLKGNIYLGRVTRVEPSLQAAFVEYGGNRHGFLAFSEIHPDYYQIPVADRLALLEAEEKAARAESDDEDQASDKDNKKKRSNKKDGRKSKKSAALAEDTDADVISEDIDTDDAEEPIELVGAEDAMEEVPDRRRMQRKEYQIQEVIKRRQILLVQVVKEERGNKGAALTTYMSLAGRYSVLMPNTARGVGISRKITNLQDRKRLKEVVKSLDVPKGMGVILRTAGANRTKSEIKRDYEYLMRLWDNVRNLTLESTAPALVYEEGSLIKRSIRDLYNKDIGEILVSGEQGYREAKDFMRMLMPSHAKVVQPYRDSLPIFARNGIEAQLDKILQPQVTLKSGGYLVINQTEALVAIDVNSGRSTKEHSVEETALQTNLEAAEEVARQLRLRDLAGLVVIDFIDMEEKRNIRTVEKRLKDCLKEDRARIQVGRISHFGLMEMSRQRIRASVLESTMQACSHCAGTGYIRSDSSMSLHIIRSIEEYLLRNPGYNIIVRTPFASAIYVLNHKRDALTDLERRFGLSISIEADDNVGVQNLAIYKGEVSTRVAEVPAPLPPVIEEEIDEIIVEEIEEIEETESEQTEQDSEDRNRRRRRRNGRRQDRETDGEKVEGIEPGEHARADSNDDERRRRRRRGRRGGRRYRDNDGERQRLPLAEPIGPFAEKALAEVRLARQQRNAAPRKLPNAEPVGALFADKSEKQTTRTAENNQNRRRKNVKKSRAPMPVVTTETAVEVIAAEVVEETKPIKKNTRKSNKNTTQAIEIKTVPQAENVDEKPKRRAKKKVADLENTNTLEAAPSIEGSEKATKPAARRRKAAVSQNSGDVAAGDVFTIEPVVTSSSEVDEGETKAKRSGWWQKKGFF